MAAAGCPVSAGAARGGAGTSGDGLASVSGDGLAGVSGDGLAGASGDGLAQRAAAASGAMAVFGAVGKLREALLIQEFPLLVAGAEQGSRARDQLLHQLDDYVLPRFLALHAPLLAVVGGSTGAGKSTLVNSLLGQEVAAASAIRPTTRRPLLLHNPADASWFEGSRILPGYARVRVAGGPGGAPATATKPPAGMAGELEIRAAPQLPPGLALLDAPDIDSVVDSNRATATQLLAAADLWLFVTTAARYADNVPWEALHSAAARNIVTAVVLNRVSPEDVGVVRPDLAARLAAAHLSDAPLFTIPELPIAGGLIPSEHVAPLRGWLEELGADADRRAAVARQTLEGAVRASVEQAARVAEAARSQVETIGNLRAEVERAQADALARVKSALGAGSLLRGEVLVRWQEFVGTGEMFARFQARVGAWRDRVGAAFRGQPAPSVQVTAAVEDSLAMLLRAEARQGALAVEQAWLRPGSGGGALLPDAFGGLPSEAALDREIADQVAGWQRDVLAMIRAEGAGRRQTARALSTGINALGVTLMILLFASTGGLTGAELAAAGGTAAASQAVLVAVFGEEAVRRMTTQARGRLEARAGKVLGWYLAGFGQTLDGLGVDAAVVAELERAIGEVPK